MLDTYTWLLGNIRYSGREREKDTKKNLFPITKIDNENNAFKNDK